MSHVREKFFSRVVLFLLFMTPVFLSLGVAGCGSTSTTSSTTGSGSTTGGSTTGGDTTGGGTTGGSTTGGGTSSACTTFTSPSSDHPWPMFRGDENHTGLSTTVGPQATTSVWTFTASTDVGNPPNSIAIADDGTIFLAGGNKVYSINPTSHAENWSKSYAAAQGPALSSDGATVYFGYDPTQEPDTAGTIVALNTSDGSLKWSYATSGAVHFGPTVGPDGTVYQGSWDHDFYAINPDDGSLKWQYTTDGAVSYPPSVMDCGDSELIVLGGGDAHEGQDGNIYAFDTDGNLQWSYDTTQLRVGTPVIGPDGLIYAPGGPTLYVLDASGALQWSLGDTQNYNFGIISPAIAADGTIYYPNSGGQDAAEVYAIDPTTQAVKTGWPYTLSGSDNGIPSFPVVDSEGTIYFGDTTNHKIYAVDKDGNEVFSYTTGDEMAEAAPALVNGVLYISSDDGKLYVIGP